MISELSNSVKLIDENETLNLTSWPRPRGLYDLHFSLFLSVALATLIFFGTLKLAQIYLYQAFKCVFFSLFCPFMAGHFPSLGFRKIEQTILRQPFPSLYPICFFHSIKAVYSYLEHLLLLFPSPSASPRGKATLLQTAVSRASRAVPRCSANIWRMNE